MHYSRFHENILTTAITNEHISSAERRQIEEFWYDNIMYNVSAHLDFLTGLGFELQERDEEKYEIVKWPVVIKLKIMQLLVCKQNPRKWVYQDEKGNFLFGYIIQENEHKLSINQSEF